MSPWLMPCSPGDTAVVLACEPSMAAACARLVMAENLWPGEGSAEPAAEGRTLLMSEARTERASPS